MRKPQILCIKIEITCNVPDHDADFAVANLGARQPRIVAASWPWIVVVVSYRVPTIVRGVETMNPRGPKLVHGIELVVLHAHVAGGDKPWDDVNIECLRQ